MPNGNAPEGVATVEPEIVPIDAIVAQELGTETGGITPLQQLGYKIFNRLLLLILLELAVLAAYGLFTYPGGSAWDDNKDAWLTSLKDLGQLFLLTPVFPLLGAVIGYMFGRQQQAGEE